MICTTHNLNMLARMDQAGRFTWEQLQGAIRTTMGQTPLQQTA